MNEDSQKQTRSKSLLLFLFILFTTLLCYWNSLLGEFVGDDHIVVERNRDIRSLSYIPKLFHQNYWGEGYEDQGNYRPLTNVSFAVNYAVGGLEPFGYHLLNVLLHAANGALVFLLIRRYTKHEYLSLAAALLFIVHPVHVEAVSQIAGRTELLAGVFCLLSWFSYINKERGKRYYI